MLLFISAIFVSYAFAQAVCPIGLNASPTKVNGDCTMNCQYVCGTNLCTLNVINSQTMVKCDPTATGGFTCPSFAGGGAGQLAGPNCYKCGMQYCSQDASQIFCVPGCCSDPSGAFCPDFGTGCVTPTKVSPTSCDNGCTFNCNNYICTQTADGYVSCKTAPAPAPTTGGGVVPSPVTPTPSPGPVPVGCGSLVTCALNKQSSCEIKAGCFGNTVPSCKCCSATGEINDASVTCLQGSAPTQTPASTQCGTLQPCASCNMVCGAGMIAQCLCCSISFERQPATCVPSGTALQICDSSKVTPALCSLIVPNCQGQPVCMCDSSGIPQPSKSYCSTGGGNNPTQTPSPVNNPTQTPPLGVDPTPTPFNPNPNPTFAPSPGPTFVGVRPTQTGALVSCASSLQQYCDASSLRDCAGYNSICRCTTAGVIKEKTCGNMPVDPCPGKQSCLSGLGCKADQTPVCECSGGEVTSAKCTGGSGGSTSYSNSLTPHMFGVIIALFVYVLYI